jgi:pheromone a factor receptor
MKTPTFGVVPIDKWCQVATGYILLFVFGTGTDALNTYRAMMLSVGLGRWFPGLYRVQESGNVTPVSMRTWKSRANSVLWSRSVSVANTTTGSTTRHNSIVLPEIGQVHTGDAILSPHEGRQLSSTRSSFLSRIFARSAVPHTVLPLFTHRSHSMPETTDTRLAARGRSPGISAHAWVTLTDEVEFASQEQC